MDSYFKKLFLDRIYRINKIFSRFPDETVKTKSACGEILTASIPVQRHFDLVIFMNIFFPRSGLNIAGFFRKPAIKKILKILLILSNIFF